MQGAVGLTEQQKEAVLTARNDLLSRMTSVLEERQSLVNSLQVNLARCPAHAKLSFSAHIYTATAACSSS